MEKEYRLRYLEIALLDLLDIVTYISDQLSAPVAASDFADKLDPSYQAWSYANILEDYNEAVQREQVSLYPCAYLHNYIRSDNDPMIHPVYQDYIDKAPVFTKGDALKLRGFITSYIKKSDQKKSLYLIDQRKIKPSKSLQDSLVNMLKGNQEFTMIDEQKVVYETARQVLNTQQAHLF